MHIHINKQLLLPAGIGGVGLVIGFGAGFAASHFRNRKIIQRMEETSTELQVKMVKLGEILKDRTAQLEVFGTMLDRMSDTEKAESAIGMPGQEELPLIKETKPLEREPFKVLKPAKVSSVFPVSALPKWEQEKENKDRERFQGRPYTISVDEFQENEFDFSQYTLTYYEGDQVLIDQEDVPIYNHPNVVGDIVFGHGSGDPNVVYVRNVRGKVEYEILRDSGFYAVEVLGNDIEAQHEEADIKHSNNRRLRKDD